MRRSINFYNDVRKQKAHYSDVGSAIAYLAEEDMVEFVHAKMAINRYESQLLLHEGSCHGQVQWKGRVRKTGILVSEQP